MTTIDSPEWDALEAALEAYVASQNGHVVRDWVIVAATRAVELDDLDGTSGSLEYAIMAPDHVAPHAASGLLRIAVPLAEGLWDPEDDDDL